VAEITVRYGQNQVFKFFDFCILASPLLMNKRSQGYHIM